jgi:predicted transcriptional regulator
VKKTFPAILRKLIDDAGHLTDKSFADHAGIPQQTLSCLLNGSRRPSWDTVQTIAKALGVSTDVFRDKK